MIIGKMGGNEKDMWLDIITDDTNELMSSWLLIDDLRDLKHQKLLNSNKGRRLSKCIMRQGGDVIQEILNCLYHA